MAKHKTCSPLGDQWVILSSSKAFDSFQTRRDEIRCVFDPLYSFILFCIKTFQKKSCKLSQKHAVMNELSALIPTRKMMHP